MFNELAGALAFDMDYARWVDEHQRLINDLRSALNSQLGDIELQVLVEGVMRHYNEEFRLKSIGAKADVFHILYGLWKTPTERLFMWLGGFRSSELLKVVDQAFVGLGSLSMWREAHKPYKPHRYFNLRFLLLLLLLLLVLLLAEPQPCLSHHRSEFVTLSTV